MKKEIVKIKNKSFEKVLIQKEIQKLDKRIKKLWVGKTNKPISQEELDSLTF